MKNNRLSKPDEKSQQLSKVYKYIKKRYTGKFNVYLLLHGTVYFLIPSPSLPTEHDTEKVAQKYKGRSATPTLNTQGDNLTCMHRDLPC